MRYGISELKILQFITTRHRFLSTTDSPVGTGIASVEFGAVTLPVMSLCPYLLRLLRTCLASGVRPPCCSTSKRVSTDEPMDWASDHTIMTTGVVSSPRVWRPTVVLDQPQQRVAIAAEMVIDLCTAMSAKSVNELERDHSQRRRLRHASQMRMRRMSGWIISTTIAEVLYSPSLTNI